MKRKLIGMVLIAVMLSGCGSNATTQTTESNEPVASEATTEASSEQGDLSELDALGEVEVEEKLFDVELTIPADYVGEKTQADLDEMAKESGYKSITLNDDGSATYIMTKAQHRQMLDELTESMNETLNEMIESESYPNFKKIEANSNFTEFNITTSSTELDMNESFSVMAFYMYGGMYNIFSGDNVDNIVVNFINEESGEIISTSNSSDMSD